MLLIIFILSRLPFFVIIDNDIHHRNQTIYWDFIFYLASRTVECLIYLNQSKESLRRNQEDEPQGKKTIIVLFILYFCSPY